MLSKKRWSDALPERRKVWGAFRSNLIYFVLVYLFSFLFTSPLFNQILEKAHSPLGGGFLTLVITFFVVSLLQTALVIKILNQCLGTELGVGESLRRGLRQFPEMISTIARVLSGILIGLFLFIIPGIYFAAASIYAIPLSVARVPGLSSIPIRVSFRLTKPALLPLMAFQLGLIGSSFAVIYWYGRNLPSSATGLGAIAMGIFGVLAYALWTSFSIAGCAKAISQIPTQAQEELPAVKPFAMGLRALGNFVLIMGAIFVFVLIVMFALGSWMSTPAGLKAVEAWEQKAGLNANVVVHGKTILATPNGWRATQSKEYMPIPPTGVEETDSISYQLQQKGVASSRALKVVIVWLPIQMTSTAQREVATRVGEAVVQKLNAMSIARVKDIKWVRSATENYLSEWKKSETSETQINSLPAWMIRLERYNSRKQKPFYWRIRFLPYAGGVLVISDSYEEGTEKAVDQTTKPLLAALSFS